MAARNEFVYDEDDYVPPGYVPPKPANDRKNLLVAVVIVGFILGAIGVVFVLRGKERTRFARAQRAAAMQKGTTELRMGPANDSFPLQSSRNWNRIVGSWSRTVNDDENTYPVRFDIEPDGNAIVTYRDDTVREVRMNILQEGQNSIQMEALPRVSDLENAGERFGRFHFTFRMDGTSQLDARMGGPVFVKH
jgi:hypothetical protein